MMQSTAMKVALVTGANKGIGLETARQLAQQGFTVLLGSRDETRGRQAAEKLKAEGLAMEPVKLDVTSDADRKAVARLVADRFGRLDVLINNAGTADFGSQAATIADEQLRATFEANFFAAVALTRELLPLIRKSDAGRIVNVSSQLGSLTLNSGAGFGDFAMAGYNPSKAALNMYTIRSAGSSTWTSSFHGEDSSVTHIAGPYLECRLANGWSSGAKNRSQNES